MPCRGPRRRLVHNEDAAKEMRINNKLESEEDATP
jgi:hypothetical protein